jgi:hypothetical protein
VAWVFLLVTLLAPFVLYASVEAKLIFHFHQRYVWWVLLALALFIGAGSAYMPRVVRIGVIGTVLVLMAGNIYDRMTPERFYNYEENFAWLATQVEPGDVLIRDSYFCALSCGHGGMTWNYYQLYYLGHSIQQVYGPADARRVWYIRSSGTDNADLMNRILAGRLRAQFTGPGFFYTQLYIAPPDPEGVLYENGLRFHGVDFLDADGYTRYDVVEVKERETLHVRLWWSIDAPLPQGYSVSTRILSQDGAIIAQQDAAPQPIHIRPLYPLPLPESMLEWETNTLYVDERFMEIPDLNDFHHSELTMIVYDWQDDNTRFHAAGVDDMGVRHFPNTEIFVWGW